MSSDYTLLNDEPDELEAFVDMLFAEVITTHNEAMRTKDDDMAKANIAQAKTDLLARFEQEKRAAAELELRTIYSAFQLAIPYQKSRVRAELEPLMDSIAWRIKELAKPKENTNAN